MFGSYQINRSLFSSLPFTVNLVLLCTLPHLFSLTFQALSRADLPQINICRHLELIQTVINACIELRAQLSAVGLQNKLSIEKSFFESRHALSREQRPAKGKCVLNTSKRNNSLFRRFTGSLRNEYIDGSLYHLIYVHIHMQEISR